MGGYSRGRLMPRWLLLTMMTTLLWGVWGFEAKLVVDRATPFAAQVMFTAGMLMLGAAVLFSRDRYRGVNRARGVFYAVLTGILGGVGNVFFLIALQNGKASIIVPLTSLAPVVTVLVGVTVMREKVSRYQVAGLGLALVAIFLLSL